MLRKLKGFTLIELLIVVAIIAILAAIAIPNFLEAQVRAKVARVRADLRSLAIGVESYYVDNSVYPAQDSSSPQADANGSGYGANNFAPANGTTYNNNEIFGRNVPTFRRKKNVNDPMRTLTTPVAYLTSFFSDPFADVKRSTFAYSATPTGTSWIMWSFGPDTDQGNDAGSKSWVPKHGGDIKCEILLEAPFTMRVETFYYPGSENRIPSRDLTDDTYDPTNGSTSNGDVYKYKD